MTAAAPPAAPHRAVPIRVPITPGESLDSWLEALARRNTLSVASLLAALGLPTTQSGHGLALLLHPPADLLRRLEHQTGLPPGRLDQAAPDAFGPLGWRRRCRGSRYCPRCLSGSGGRWPTAWRLPWVFCCPGHQSLLCDACPACGHSPRARLHGGGPHPPAACTQPISSGVCGTDLSSVPASRVGEGHPLQAAQRWINTLLAAVAADPTAAARGVFAELRVVGDWLRRHGADYDLGDLDPDLQHAWRAYQVHAVREGSTASPYAPEDARVVGVVTTLGMAVIGGQDADRTIGQLRALVHDEHRHPRLHGPPDLHCHQWGQLSPRVQGRFLRAIDTDLTHADRLRYRSCTPNPRSPDDPALTVARLRSVPQLLWPDWTIRLQPLDGFKTTDAFRATIAACLLLPGHPDRQISRITTLLQPHRFNNITSTLTRLAARGHHSILAAICHLADELDTHPTPIDYQRRRDLITPDVISADQWRHLCLQAGAHPGHARRLLDARRYLHQLLTGNDLTNPAHPLAFRGLDDRSKYRDFTTSLTPPLRDALADHATGHLQQLSIDEPLTWQPPASCCAHLALPGRDPDDIDLRAVHQLIVVDRLTLGRAARRLGTTIDHIRLSLERVPRTPRQWAANAPPMAWQQRQRAQQILTPGFFQREYVMAGKPLRQIATEIRINRAIVAERARHAGITSATHRPIPIDEDWLRQQYLQHKRSAARIAADLGVSSETVLRAARDHGIPIRPAGVASHRNLLRTYDDRLPTDVRRAVEGQRYGWQRLQRFQAAMTHPNLATAARHLHLPGSGVLVKQLHRLEHDIGAQLYHRATPTQPARPTPRGTALLQMLARPDIRALAEEVV